MCPSWIKVVTVEQLLNFLISQNQVIFFDIFGGVFRNLVLIVLVILFYVLYYILFLPSEHREISTHDFTGEPSRLVSTIRAALFLECQRLLV